jgi:hypothetical protein
MITPALLREWGACHDDKAIALLARGRMSATPREIATDDNIDLDDRLWVICRALWYRDEDAARKYAIDSAALVSHLAGRPEDCAEHARLVEDLRRIFAIPAGDRRSDELQRWTAAWDAAWTAARNAAWTAAWTAAWNAPRDAAWTAARNAAWTAARAAAWAAAADAWAAELRKAIDRALQALGPDADGWTA